MDDLNPQNRKELLKHMILQLHEGEAPQEVRGRLVELLKSIPYNEVVTVEQELINEGLPEEEVLKFCDIHHEAMDGAIDQTGAKEIPEGHPADTFKKENKELLKLIAFLYTEFDNTNTTDDIDPKALHIQLKGFFNSLADVEKHYLRKENLLFPFLEKYNITGPPKVMWGKHDETRELMKAAIEALHSPTVMNLEELKLLIDVVLKPAAKSIADMVLKEEEILFPMCMDKLTDEEWYDIQTQSIEIGYCLYDPADNWKPEGIAAVPTSKLMEGYIQLPSGKMNPIELNNMLNLLPVEITFVDANDKVKYFSQSKHTIFGRNRAILGRDVRLCHPPKSVDTVERIVSDFKSGKEEKAAFWIQMMGKFVHIVYYAVRDEKGKYLGTMEVVQDISELRALEGEQRLLNYND